MTAKTRRCGAAARSAPGGSQPPVCLMLLNKRSSQSSVQYQADMLFVRRLTAGLAVRRTSQRAAGCSLRRVLIPAQADVRFTGAVQALTGCCEYCSCVQLSAVVLCSAGQAALWPGPGTTAQLAVIQQRGHCRSYIYSLVGSSMIRAARRSGAHPVIIGKNEPLVKIDCR